MSGITAAQARENSQTSTYGASDVVNQLSQAIEANSKTGSTSITSMFSKEAVSESELQTAIATMESRGFEVERMDTSAAQYVIQVNW